MKASDILGLPVRDPRGQDLGIVTDLRCVQDGPLRGSMNAPRVQSVVVTSRRTGSLLGYHRPEQTGPWLIRAVVSRLSRPVRVLDWDDLELNDTELTLRRPYSSG
ncbi:MAG: hypothetical protein QOK10_528 [Pseudonocardiales bacterium]|jgi:hypothetical protein|nr:hypothetical protein [Pseudonocardiales bacterium]